jgi:cytoskeleton protein RodZ
MTNQNSTIDSPSSRTDIPQATPGVMLSSAREAAGISDKEIADQLRIPLLRLQALEADQYENLSAETFVLGYIRAYARAVNLEADVVIDAYYQYLGQLHKTTERITHSAESGDETAEATSNFWQKPSVWIGGLLLAWLILFNLFSGDSQPPQTLLEEKPVIEASVLDAEVIEPSVETVVEGAVTEKAVEIISEVGDVEGSGRTTEGSDGTAEGSARIAEGSSAVVQEAEATEQVESESAIDTSTGSVAGNLDVLVLSFSGECWLEVTDSRGDVLNADLQQDGDRVVLEGIAPFDIMLGNVRAVDVTLNDEVVDLKPRGFRKTLRTQIGAP